LEHGHELGLRDPGWRHPSAKWVSECRRLVAFDERLPAVLRKADRPINAEESFLFVTICAAKHLYVTSARLAEEVLVARPEEGRDLSTARRYRAACAAARAGAGDGKDEPAPDEASRSHWRRRALEWLEADLAAWNTQTEKGSPQTRSKAWTVLTHWRRDPDLASLREEAPLSRLPESDRTACRALWSKVDSLLATASTKPVH
jgi:hypothetical protein